MIDMLVALYDLPEEDKSLLAALQEEGILIRHAKAYELHQLVEWIGHYFSAKWQSEATIALSAMPPSCFIATHKGSIVGFACYDTTARGFFGPTGVSPHYRGKGIGKALLIKALYALKQKGYVYGIIGGVGPQDFYKKTCHAQPIKTTSAGIYEDILPEKSYS